MDIAKEHPGKWVFGGLRTAFLNPQSSFQDDRNGIETGAIFPIPGNGKDPIFVFLMMAS
jgi:hypothetical protein